MDGAKDAEGIAISIRGRFSRSQALLRQMIAASMAHITKKYVDSR